MAQKSKGAVSTKRISGPVGMAKIQDGRPVDVRYKDMDPAVVYQMRLQAMQRGMRTPDYVMGLAKLHIGAMVAARKNEVIAKLLQEYGLGEVSIG